MLDRFGRVCVSVFGIAAIIAGCVGGARADDPAQPKTLVFIDAARGVVPGVRAVNGPASIEFVAVNPLQYPFWSVKVDNVVRDGPGVTLTGSAQSLIQGIDNGLGAPSPAAVATPAAYLPVFSMATIASDPGAPHCTNAALAPPPPGTPGTVAQVSAINACYAEVQVEFAKLEAVIAADVAALQKAEMTYNMLMARTSDLLASTRARCTDWVAMGAVVVCPIPANGKTTIQNLSDNITKYIIGGVAPIDPVSIVGVEILSGKVGDWPSDMVAGLTGSLTSLQSTLLTVPATLSFAAVGPCIVAAAKGPVTTCKSSVDANLATLKTQASSAPLQSEYATEVSALRAIAQRIGALNVGRFVFRDDEACLGLNGSSRSRTYTFQLDDKTASSVAIVCQSRVFVSQGVAISNLQQTTYANVPINPLEENPAGLPSPVPSGLGRIQASAQNYLRPIPVALVNYRILDLGQSGEGGIFSSFGLGLNSTASGTNIDYVGGVSFGLSRAALLTIGGNLSQATFLAPGYHTGDLLVGSPQTVTHYTTGLMFGVTYGKQ